MLKACIEIISTGQHTWIEIPNENLSSVISDFTGDKDWECVIITGLKKDGITMFPNNQFHKCDIFKFNDMLLQAQDFQYEDDNLVVLNLLLEEVNFDCDDVIYLYENDKFNVYKNAKDMGDVAREWLEYHALWYEKAKEAESHFDHYFDFKSYGEEVLLSSGNWLQDKFNEIIVEVLD